MQTKKRYSASITAEASMVMPLFILALLTLSYLLVMVEVNLAVHEKSVELGRNVSDFAPLLDLTGDLKTDAVQRLGISSDIADFALGFVEAGAVEIYFSELTQRHAKVMTEVSFYGSGISDDGTCMIISVSYNIRPPINLFGIIEVPVSQRLMIRLFNGCAKELLEADEDEDDEASGDETTVYVTETGTVYHVSKRCTHLKLSTHSVLFASISQKRNNNGGKYYPCERCAHGASPGSVYITNEGTRYHYAASCSGLKRTVKEMTLEEAKKTFRPCSRCAKED